jgi:hypothetical protein
MKTPRQDLLLALAIFVMMIGGHVLAHLFGRYLPAPSAKGLAFFAVVLGFYLILGKRSRYGLLPSLGVCLLAGVLAFIGELILPGW